MLPRRGAQGLSSRLIKFTSGWRPALRPPGTAESAPIRHRGRRGRLASRLPACQLASSRRAGWEIIGRRPTCLPPTYLFRRFRGRGRGGRAPAGRALRGRAGPAGGRYGSAGTLPGFRLSAAVTEADRPAAASRSFLQRRSSRRGVISPAQGEPHWGTGACDAPSPQPITPLLLSSAGDNKPRRLAPHSPECRDRRLQLSRGPPDATVSPAPGQPLPRPPHSQLRHGRGHRRLPDALAPGPAAREAQGISA